MSIYPFGSHISHADTANLQALHLLLHLFSHLHHCHHAPQFPYIFSAVETLGYAINSIPRSCSLTYSPRRCFDYVLHPDVIHYLSDTFIRPRRPSFIPPLHPLLPSPLTAPCFPNASYRFFSSSQHSSFALPPPRPSLTPHSRRNRRHLSAFHLVAPSAPLQMAR